MTGMRMTDILFIKTSSLGDVIHHMPAVSDARRQHPQAHIAWVVEEAFAPLARLHPGVNTVIPVASRRWRHAPFAAATWREIGAFRAVLRARTYDAVIDTQGLARTALIARFAHGPRYGYDTASVRERAAAWFYDKTFRVGRQLHAIERNRVLTALALGYTMRFPPDYGLQERVAQTPGNHAVLLHATAQAGKEWPEANWIALGGRIAARGIEVLLPWGNDRECARAERLAAAIPNARVPERQPLDAVAAMLAGARFVVGVDTGLVHLAAALNVPLVAIFTGSVPALTGPVGIAPLAVVGAQGLVPSVGEVEKALALVEAEAVR